MTHSQDLVAEYAKATPRKMMAQWWPIMYPDFKDLPPTIQMKVAEAQMAEERRRREVV